MKSLEILFQPPLINSFLVFLSIMITFSSLKRTLHPLSQNRPIESNALLSSEKRCTFRAFFGKSVFLSNPISVDCITVPFATSTDIGFFAILRCVTVAVLGR